eukprot:s2478_g11.t1
MDSGTKDGPLALEDRPVGEPISYGPPMPVGVNPFWSQNVQDEASLMAMRPSSLPPLEGNDPGVATTATMEVAQLAACRLEPVVYGGFGNMSPDGQRGPGNRDMPSPEQGHTGNDLTEVLRAILHQNQLLAREVAMLKRKVDEPSRDLQTPILVTPASSVGEKGDGGGKGSGVAAIEQGRGSPIGEGVRVGQSGQPPNAPDGPGETGVVAGGELPPRTPGPGEVGVGTGGEYSRRAPGGPSGALAPGASGVCRTDVNVLAPATPPSLPALAKDAGKVEEGRYQVREVPQGSQGQQGFSGVDVSAGLQGVAGLNLGWNGLLGPYATAGGGGCGVPIHHQPAGGVYQPAGGVHQPIGGEMPSWLKSLATASSQETIRTVEIPKLPEIRDGEMGSLVVGDWIALVSPTMKDLSGQSCKWWEAVLRAASEAYAQWLRVEPLQKLYVIPEDPCLKEPAWARVEQRGQAMMLSAIPDALKSEVLANRTTSTVQVLFRIFTRYQPGGLGERALLLRQLVEPKSHSNLSDMVEHLRNWKRWLRRAGELQIAVPDPTLLVGALEKLGATLVNQSVQASFRLSSARAQLQIDVNPSAAGVTSYADVLLAEAEAALHSGSQPAAAKVKALEVGGVAKVAEKREGGGDPEGKRGSSSTPCQVQCKFFLTEGGCKKGSECGFKHEWLGTDKYGRCWNCGGSNHSRRDCPVKTKRSPEKALKAVSGDRKEVVAKGGEEMKPKSGEGAVAAPKKEIKGEAGSEVAKKGEDGKSEGNAVKELMLEAAGLLRSLKGPSLKKISLSSLEVKNQRSLLDGGATHCLRKPESEEEWTTAKEVEVHLAEGSTILRQKPWSRTLLTQGDVQPIVPLGVLVELCGYAVRWEGSNFELTDQSGRILDTTLEGNCPTVDEELGLELIKEIEAEIIKQKVRLNALQGKVLTREEESLLGEEHIRWLRLLKAVFPSTPDEVLARVPPKEEWKGQELPWNRRRRRRMLRAKEVVIHLFSGPDAKFWEKELSSPEREVICLDLEIDKRHDLRSDHLFAVLVHLCQRGTVRCILGGPPCRTVSRLRHTQPGPPPLRARSGPERFGLLNLDAWLRRRVEEDTTLWLRQLFLHMVAEENSPGPVAFVKESPQDPESYSPTPEGKEKVPSFWAFEEWKAFSRHYGMEEVSFDQGPMGHQRKKPTTLGTNVVVLRELAEIRGPGAVAGSHWETVEERIKASKEWACWAPGLKRALVVVLRCWLGSAEVKKLSVEEWKTHLQNDHLPFRRDCQTCLQSAGKSRYHRRIVSREALTLSIDLAGPFKRGIDQGPADKLGAARYFMAGTFTVPVTPEGKSLMKKEPEPEVDEDPSVVLEEEEVEVQEAANPGAVDEEEKWLEKIEEEMGFEVRHVTLLEPLEDRRASEIVRALSRMLAKLRYMGFDVRRLHSDRAGEFTASQVRKWGEDRGIFRTFTDGDGWKSNGRVESEIAVLKRGIKTLLNSAGLADNYWPLAARHFAERRWRQQLAAMNYPVDPLKVFGKKAWAKVKRWEDRSNAWRKARKEVTILGPDATMSSSSQGYYVEDQHGKFFHSADLVEGAEPPPEDEEREVEGAIPPEELWHVDGNIYGLTTSPRDWADHRDATFQSFKWTSEESACCLERTREENLWKLRKWVGGVWQTVGHLAIYIDDLLITGEKPVVRDFLERVKQEWSVSEPEWCTQKSTLRFCGVEVSRCGDGIKIHQESYIRDLLDRHGTQGISTMSSVSMPEEESSVDPSDVKAA